MKRVLVVGASGALGRAVLSQLRGRSVRAALTYNQGEGRAREGAEGLRDPWFARMDVRDPVMVDRVVGEAHAALGGAIDALVYCAGLATDVPGVYQRWDTVTADGWDAMFHVNVRGPFLCAQALARREIAPGGANVVFVGSVDGAKQCPTSVPFATSKGALVALAHALTKDLGPRGVRTNVVAPGLLQSGASSIVPDEIRREYLKHSALKRYGTLAEAASLVTWLALDNTYITGRTLVLDGGL